MWTDTFAMKTELWNPWKGCVWNYSPSLLTLDSSWWGVLPVERNIELYLLCQQNCLLIPKREYVVVHNPTPSVDVLT